MSVPSENEAKSLLIEIGTEELPPKSLDELAAAFTRGICDGLVKRGVAAAVDNAKTCASPRRLAVLVPDVATAQPEQASERRGPALTAGLDANSAPTKALLGFAQSCGVDVARLEKLETDKGAWFVHRATNPGRGIAALIPEIIAEALKALPIPKPMRWGDHDYAFVRPAHWLVVLHGADVLDVECLGLRSGRASRGHRFMHDAPVEIAHADAWLDALRAARVLADPAERRERVREEVARAAKETGGQPRLSDALLDEIANLTEWPVAIACAFDEAFLAVPPEALVMTMETNQKFVPVFTADGKLSEHFIGVANIASKDPAEIRKGYERVIRPRFADAKFFCDEDLKTPLVTNQDALKNITYQKDLGSVWDKTLRVIELARVIANRLRDQGVDIDPAQVVRAAELSKCDLVTRMVGEFPELQGVMGRYYASANGEPKNVADALDAFYRPRFAGDAIADGKVAQVLGVAERLDTLAGIFAVGMKPTGNKDPFALRRAALGLARTLIEGNLALDLKALLREIVEHTRSVVSGNRAREAENAALTERAQRAVDDPFHSMTRDLPLTPITPASRPPFPDAVEVYDFIVDRLRGYYADQGISAEAFEAVRALAPSDLTDFDRRVRAVVEFAQLPEAAALAAANKRIGNILRQAGDDKTGKIDDALLEAGTERDLAAVLAAARVDAGPLISARDYVGLLKRLAALRDPVDRYFTDVMVMADDAALRTNRLALLTQLRALFLRVADISLLPGA